MKPILLETADRLIGLFSKSSTGANWTFGLMLFGLREMLNLTARKHPSFKERLKQQSFTAQISTRKNPVGRWYCFKNGKVISKAGFHPDPDITILYHDAALGARLMIPWRDQLAQISAMRSFKIDIAGAGRTDGLVHRNHEPDDVHRTGIRY